MDASKNSGTPKSSNLIGFSIINHPFWGTPIFGNTHINWCRISSINCFDRPNFDLGRVFWPPTSLWLSGWLLWHLPINCKDILNCHKVLLVVTTYYNITQELKCSFTLIPYIYIYIDAFIIQNNWWPYELSESQRNTPEKNRTRWWSQATLLEPHLSTRQATNAWNLRLCVSKNPRQTEAGLVFKPPTFDLPLRSFTVRMWWYNHI